MKFRLFVEGHPFFSWCGQGAINEVEAESIENAAEIMGMKIISIQGLKAKVIPIKPAKFQRDLRSCGCSPKAAREYQEKLVIEPAAKNKN